MKTKTLPGINLVKRLLSFVLLMLIASLTACTSTKGNKTQLSKVTNKIGAKQDASRAKKMSTAKTVKAVEVVAKSDVEAQADPEVMQPDPALFPQTETPASVAYKDQPTPAVDEPMSPMEEGKPEGQKPDDFLLRQTEVELPEVAAKAATTGEKAQTIQAMQAKGSIDDDRPFMEQVIEEDPEYARRIEAKASFDYEYHWALIFERQDAAARQLAEAKRIRAEVIAEEQAAALAKAETDATPTEDTLMQTIETPIPTPAIEIKPAIVVSKESPPEPKTSTTFTRPIMTVSPKNSTVSKVSNGFLIRSTLEVLGLPNTECVSLGELVIRPINNGSDNLYVKFGPKGQADGEFIKLNRESEIVAENMRSGLVLKDEPLATYFRYPLTVSGKVSQDDAGAAPVEYEITLLASESVDGVQMWASAEGDSYEFTNGSIMRKSNQPFVVAQNTIREAEKTWSPQATDETSFATAMEMITKQYAVNGKIFSPLTDAPASIKPPDRKNNLMLAGVGGSLGGSAKTTAGLIFLGMILVVVLLYTMLYRCGILSHKLRLAFFGQPLTREQQLDAVPFERPRETFLQRKFDPEAFRALAKAGLKRLQPRRRSAKAEVKANADVCADASLSPEQKSETTGSIPVASEQTASAQDAKPEAKDEMAPTPTALTSDAAKAEESLPVDGGVPKPDVVVVEDPAKVKFESPFTVDENPKNGEPKDGKAKADTSSQASVSDTFRLVRTPEENLQLSKASARAVIPAARKTPDKLPSTSLGPKNPAEDTTTIPITLNIPLPSGKKVDLNLLANSIVAALSVELGNTGKADGDKNRTEHPGWLPFGGKPSPKPLTFMSVEEWETENGPPPKHQPKPKSCFVLPDQQEETVADEVDGKEGAEPKTETPPQTDTAA